jgi:hypothetical protein
MLTNIYFDDQIPGQMSLSFELQGSAIIDSSGKFDLLVGSSRLEPLA